MNYKLLACLGLAAMLFAPAARAVVFCVDTSTELRNALTTAASNGQDDTIRIKPGTYGGLPADSFAFFYETAQNNALTISGGWADSGIFDCFAPVGDPTDTVLTGFNQQGVLRMVGAPGSTGAMAVQKLTIRDGNGIAPGGGLGMGLQGGFAGNLLVDRVYFLSNNSLQDTGGALLTTNGTATILSSWFDSSFSETDAAAAKVFVNHTNNTEARAFIGNNTFTSNVCLGQDCRTGGLEVGGTARSAIYNNAFNLNSAADIGLEATSVLFNNFFQLQDGSVAAITSVGNINPPDPGFVDAIADPRLLPTSPLINAGTDDFPTGTLDFDGKPRLNDFQYDIGAFENQNVLFKDSFEAPP